MNGSVAPSYYAMFMDAQEVIREAAMRAAQLGIQLNISWFDAAFKLLVVAFGFLILSGAGWHDLIKRHWLKVFVFVFMVEENFFLDYVAPTIADDLPLEIIGGLTGLNVDLAGQMLAVRG